MQGKICGAAQVRVGPGLLTAEHVWAAVMLSRCAAEAQLAQSHCAERKSCRRKWTNGLKLSCTIHHPIRSQEAMEIKLPATRACLLQGKPREGSWRGTAVERRQEKPSLKESCQTAALGCFLLRLELKSSCRGLPHYLQPKVQKRIQTR